MGAGGGNYVERTSEQCPAGLAVGTKAACEDAARSLAWFDDDVRYTIRTVQSSSSYPPGCYFETGWGLYFNTNSSSTAQCGSSVLG